MPTRSSTVRDIPTQGQSCSPISAYGMALSRCPRLAERRRDWTRSREAAPSPTAVRLPSNAAVRCHRPRLRRPPAVANACSPARLDHRDDVIVTDDFTFRSPYLPLGTACRWLKGNHHGHSTLSDGIDTPEASIEAYDTAGYDYFALSEHDRFCDPAFYQARTAMTLLPAVEITSDLDQTLMYLGATADLPEKGSLTLAGVLALSRRAAVCSSAITPTGCTVPAASMRRSTTCFGLRRLARLRSIPV
jgi:hypothetical protein